MNEHQLFIDKEMAGTPGPIKLAWQSDLARKSMWAISVAAFALIVILGIHVGQEEEKARIRAIESSISRRAKKRMYLIW